MIELILILVVTAIYFVCSYLSYPRLVVKDNKCYIVRGLNEYLNIRYYILYQKAIWNDEKWLVPVADGIKVFKEIRGIRD